MSDEPKVEVIANRDQWMFFSPRRAFNEATFMLEENRGILTNYSIKLLKEIQVTSVFTLGVNIADKEERWVRCPEKYEATPDAYVSYLKPEPSSKNQVLVEHEIEVVTYNMSAKEDIVTFLKRTKLNMKKKYSAGAMILCHIDAKTSVPPWPEIYNQLKPELNGLQLAFLARVVKEFPGFVSVLMAEDGFWVTPNFLLYEALDVQAKDIVRLKRATGNQLTPKYINHVPMFSLPSDKK